MGTRSSAFCSRALRAGHVRRWPWALLAILLGVPAAEPADPVLSRLDARLQLLRQGQVEAQTSGLMPALAARERALLGRLAGPLARLSKSPSPRLSLLVKHRCDRNALAASGFRIESCLGSIGDDR